MPGPLNGLDLARTIRQIKPHIPILLVTGYALPVVAAASEFTVLRKPYQLADLQKAVSQVLRRS